MVHGPGPIQGHPYRLRGDQKLFLWRWFEYDENGGWRYNEALRGEARGGAKTEFLAALAILELAGPPELSPPSPDVPIAAASYDQADILFGTAGVMVGGPRDVVPEAPLCGYFDVHDTTITFRDGRPGKVYRVAAVAGTNEGGRATLFLADELHEWTGRKERLATVLGASLKKRNPPGRVIYTSTAGAGKWSTPAASTDPLLWKLYAQGLEQMDEPTAHPRFLFDWRSADESLDLDDEADRAEAVRQASGAADIIWRVSDRVEAWGSALYPRNEWLRYFANQWVASDAGGWLEDHPTAWPSCADHEAEIPEGATDVIVAVDASLYLDSTAAVTCWRAPDGRDVVRCKVWTPEDSGGVIDLGGAVSAHIKAEARRYEVREVAYDPRLFETAAQDLADDGLPMVEVPQSPESMVPACSWAFGRIVSGLVAHDEYGPLTAHVNAAARRESDRGWTLSKGRSKRRIDAAIALVIGLRRLALRHDDETENEVPSVW